MYPGDAGMEEAMWRVSPCGRRVFMVRESQADLLAKRCSCRVVRRRREGGVEDVPLEREDDAPHVEIGRAHV
jgi:hypothetical protein